jgi:hypothetical protein
LGTSQEACARIAIACQSTGEHVRQKGRPTVNSPRRLVPSLLALLTAALLLSSRAAEAQPTLYSVDRDSSLLRAIDPVTGATLSAIAITLSGQTVRNANGLATNPVTGELFALLEISGDAPCGGTAGPNSRRRRLVKIDPATGVATNIGSTNDCFAGITFHTNGTLYAVTGDGAAVPESLFSLNPATGSPTLLRALGNGTGGEAIAFNPADGLLYHASGCPICGGVTLFESINPGSLAVTNIPQSGAPHSEVTALTHESGTTLILVDLNTALFGITTTGVVSSRGFLDHKSKGLAFFGGALVSAVLPASRSVLVNSTATAFATIINAGASAAVGCGISTVTSIPATFTFQATDPATNQPTGGANAPVDIAAGASRSFILGFTPTAPIPPTDVQLSFDCTNTRPAPTNSGLNTLLLSASLSPIPDIVALAASPTPGIVNIPGATGTGVFAVATVNVGAAGAITAFADTAGAALPVSLLLCQTDPATGTCLGAPASSVTTTINANATPTFGVFVQGGGNVPFDPAANRVFVRFRDGGGVTRGSTSVAVQTQ